ncbi:MAG: dihydroneopterin aldolase [Microthrixaceae bacterium]
MTEPTIPGDSDVIRLAGLHLVGIVGVLPEERERAQPLRVDLDLHVDLSAAGLTDALGDTVDYGAVCDAVAHTVDTARPELLERLAAQIADAVFGVDGRVDSLTVSVAKLRPPVPHALDSSGVCITRRRPS